MKNKKKKPKIFETKYFGLIIGACIVVLFAFLLSNLAFIKDLEVKMLDVHFKYKDVFQKENIQEGVSVEVQNPNVSPDIIILGIDLKSLSRFGKWPFPRYRHGVLLDSLSRIQNQNERESSVFLDLFFIEPDRAAVDDVILINSIKENGRVFLETVLDEMPPPAQNAEEFYQRHEVLYKKYGEIKTVTGDWKAMYGAPGLQPPLQPYGEALRGYGHANYNKDSDDIYRRQALVAKSSVLLETMKLDDLTPDTPVDDAAFERLEWIDTNGIPHTVPYPYTEKSIKNLKEEMVSKAPLKEVDTNEDGEPDEKYYVIRKIKDHFIPSITLSSL
jgi:adenylate cyclase